MPKRKERTPAKPRRRQVYGPQEWVVEFELVNPGTGERLQGEDVPVVGTVHRKRKWTNAFFLAVQSGIERLAIHPDLTHDARRVFLLMASHVQWENVVSLSQREIAQRLEIGPARVSRTVKLLVATDFISPKIRKPTRKPRSDRLRPVKKGRSTVYELDGGVVWKGTIDQQVSFQRKWKADVKRWKEERRRVEEESAAASGPVECAPVNDSDPTA